MDWIPIILAFSEVSFHNYHQNTFTSSHHSSQVSRLTDNESKGQQEAACTCPANTTTSLLFTATNAVKLASVVTRSS